MKPFAPPSAELLLKHVVADAAPEDFRTATLDALLRGARRRRSLRRARAAAATLAIPLLAVALLCLGVPRARPTSAGSPAENPPSLAISSKKPVLLVHTRSGAELLVASRPLPSQARVATRLLAADERMRTDLRLGPRRIDDDELLALAPESSVLVRLPSGGARLVFPDQTPGP